MKQSLKSILHNELKRKGKITFNEMAEICQQNGYRISNGERRLRTSESPWVAKVMSVDGAIIAYMWVEPKTQQSFSLPVQQSIVPKFSVID